MGLQRLKLSDEIKKIIDSNTVFLIENVGIPKKIIYSEIEFIIPCIESDYLKFGHANHLHEIQFGIELKSSRVISYGNFNNSNYYSVINENLQNLLVSSFCNDFFVRRLIHSEAFGPYYDNTPKGGNFERYAGLLKDLISDIDERAANEGAWHSLIEEMSIGVI